MINSLQMPDWLVWADILSSYRVSPGGVNSNADDADGTDLMDHISENQLYQRHPRSNYPMRIT